METGAQQARPLWKVSLHGGHSSDYCDHAFSTLTEMLEAAVAAGYHAFGVSEHVPRTEDRWLYSEERARGWDVAKIQSDFARYMAEMPRIAEAFADRLIVLRGFEAEVVPTADYAQQVRNYREQKQPNGAPVFDYFVGSVHFVNEIQIDGGLENYRLALESCGGLEAFAIRYYEKQAEMADALRPPVIGHFDLVKRNAALAGYGDFPLDSPRIRIAAERALEAARACDAILDLNTAGWRKGLGEPYPAPWLLTLAHRMGLGFCFGDDSHRTTDVGAGIADARAYLLQHGVPTVTVLTREGDPISGPVVRRVVPLD